MMRRPVFLVRRSVSAELSAAILPLHLHLLRLHHPVLSLRRLRLNILHILRLGAELLFQLLLRLGDILKIKLRLRAAVEIEILRPPLYRVEKIYRPSPKEHDYDRYGDTARDRDLVFFRAFLEVVECFLHHHDYSIAWRRAYGDKTTTSFSLPATSRGLMVSLSTGFTSSPVSFRNCLRDFSS